MPVTTSMSAPSWPLVLTVPLCWNITRDDLEQRRLPGPFTPMSPIASPGSARSRCPSAPSATCGRSSSRAPRGRAAQVVAEESPAVVHVEPLPQVIDLDAAFN